VAVVAAEEVEVEIVTLVTTAVVAVAGQWRAQSLMPMRWKLH